MYNIPSPNGVECARVERAVALLEAKKIPTSQIQMLYLSDDRALAQHILKQTGGREEWPLIFINGQPVGTVNQLETWLDTYDNESSGNKNSVFYSFSDSSVPSQSTGGSTNSSIFSSSDPALSRASNLLQVDSGDESDEEIQFKDTEDSEDSTYHRSLLDSDLLLEQARNIVDEKINKKLEEEKHQSEAASPSLGYMGITLEGIERGVVEISSYMRSAMNLVGLSPPPEEMTTNTNDNRDTVAEFQVIQTNWYYRKQTRTLQFGRKSFVKINPITQDVRKTHSYMDIAKVTIPRAGEFIIDYTDKTQEFFSSPATEAIIDVINRHTPHNLVIERQ